MDAVTPDPAAWPAPAKLNLMLRIVGRRPDGYHLLQTVFQFLDRGDWLWFTPRADGVIEREGEVAGVPAEADLTVRAARLLQQATGVRQGATIRIAKRLPLGGGLGGGSSDAATDAGRAEPVVAHWPDSGGTGRTRFDAGRRRAGVRPRPGRLGGRGRRAADPGGFGGTLVRGARPGLSGRHRRGVQ